MNFASCNDNGLTCEWGSSPDPTCDATATCTSGAWAFPIDPPVNACTSSPPIMCPSSFASVPRMSSCTPEGGFCDYPEGRCACTVPGPVIMNPPNSIWICQDPAPGCPAPRPRLGAPCTPQQEGMQCDYGSCTIPGGTAEQCSGGVWTQAQFGCAVAGGGAGADAGSR